MRGTLIHNIFCTTTCQSSASILASGMSDHFPCFISLPNVKPGIMSNTIYSADYSPTALAKFKEETDKANLSDPQITLPTRLSTMRGTLIHNIFCTTTCQSSASILASGMSDHFPCFISLPIVKPGIMSNTIYSADYSPTALAKFEEETNKANLSDLVQPALMSDPNISYNNLDQVLLKAKALHIPIKQVKFDKKKHIKSLWITKGIIKSITWRDKLYRYFKQCRVGTEVYNTLKTNLHTFNRILKRNISSAKKVY